MRMLAPALSPVVMGANVGSSVLSDPALGLPLEVPPVVFVNGGAVSGMMRADKAPKTFICKTALNRPSYWPVVQWKPHMRPLAPPVHCLTAAAADVLRIGMKVSYRYGATWIELAIHRCMKPRYDSMSVLQDPGGGSQDGSNATPSWAKKTRLIPSAKPSRRPFQVALPLVYVSHYALANILKRGMTTRLLCGTPKPTYRARATKHEKSHHDSCIANSPSGVEVEDDVPSCT